MENMPYISGKVPRGGEGVEFGPPAGAGVAERERMVAYATNAASHNRSRAAAWSRAQPSSGIATPRGSMALWHETHGKIPRCCLIVSCSWFPVPRRNATRYRRTRGVS